MADTVFRFDRAELRPATRELRVDGQPVQLGARAFDLLQALVAHRERMLSKNELLDMVWPQLVVEENNLQVQVSTLRKLLGAKTIVTVPGRGYRFAATLHEVRSEPEPETPAMSVLSLPIARGQAGNLPGPAQALVGREAELVTVPALLREHRLVTLLGAGGIGKTSLARAVAQQVGHAFADGVWMVELADVSDPAALPGAVARALQLNLPGRGDPHDELATRLQGHELLLLDNCEHLVWAVAALVEHLLQAQPALRVLATSQEPLRLPSERTLRLEALAVPGPEAVHEARSHGAVALFAARVQAVQPGFDLDTGNEAAVVDICRELDGMPLALEFAAARVPLLGVAGVRQHLAQRLRVLKSGTREAPTRHRTLRATLDWSHALLREDEKKVFRRLGVFVGGFGLELAQQVAADEATDAWDVLDLLGNLIDKSMVVLETGHVPRYRLLETARVYACDQLELTGEWRAMQLAHARCMLAVFDRRARIATAGFEPMDQWVLHCTPEIDNLHSAIEWATDAGERALALDLVNLAAEFMYQAGRYPECVLWMRRVQPLIDAQTPPLVAARFKLGLAMVGLHGGIDGPTRLQLLDEARATFEQHPPPQVVLLYTMCMRAYVAGICGDLALARSSLVRAGELVQQPHLAILRGVWLYIQGMVCRYEGRSEEAFASFTEALPYVRRAGDGRTLFYLHNNLAAVHHDMGHLDEAVERYRATLTLLQASPRTDSEMLAFALNWYAHALTAQGALDEALVQVRRSVPHCRRTLGLRHFAGMLSLLAARQGRLREAALLLGCDDAARQRRGEARTPFDARAMAGTLALVGATHPHERIAVWRVQGTALDEEQTQALILGS
ncbi:winged helix-turn-helix domain-containing protein [Pseudorhodoferax sp. Leaf267]|uniref:ATP-binding protein n=1 Tax=Pseudorhodoferax sp. Leaf267 TaxID=1736316 RepID=UPI0006F3295F|nr:winged helix-turn-helix domain-containing protein [Pseudorhodoferax sp. Leaf267]KQP12791.1 hypothetical protein ASF43_21515 [Pseudorhodoferax sp. Leaf267]